MANPNIPSLELIPNQPFIFQPVDPNCLGNDNRDYCVLVNECDEIQIQEKLIFNTDCFENLLCSFFTGEELVTDGDFIDGPLYWSEAGVNWQVHPGSACYDVKDGNGVLYQTIPGLSEGTTYRLQFTIEGYESGTLTPFLWDTNGTPVSADGTYVQYITILPGHISETLEFIDSATWGGCIRAISLVELGCWDEVDSEEWILTGETACHLVGSTTPLVSNTTLPAFVSECTYELIIEISGMTTGTLTPSIGVDNFEAITANGIYSLYINSQGGDFLTFTPSSDFDGCIASVPELRRMCDYPLLGLFTLEGDFVMDLSGDGGVSVDVEGQHITWTFKLCQLEQQIDFGCYKFKLFDPCNDCFLNDNLLTNSTFDSDLSGWTAGGGFAWNAGTAQCTNTGSLIQDIGDNDYRCIRVRVISISGTPAFTLRLSQNGGGAPTSDLVITSPGVYSLFGSGGRVHFSVIGTGVVTIDDVYAITSSQAGPCDPYCYQVESNCLSWQESHPCTKHIVAYCEENSLGFNFGSTVYVGTGFKLQQRFRVVNFNPKDDKDRSTALDSAGQRKLIFSQVEEIFQLRFDYCDRFAHACISKMMECDVIQINHGEISAYPTPYDLTKEYVCVSEEYEPEWDERGARKLAQSQVEVVEIPSATFNQNLT